jgi:hypothetical protein
MKYSQSSLPLASTAQAGRRGAQAAGTEWGSAISSRSRSSGRSGSRRSSRCAQRADWQAEAGWHCCISKKGQVDWQPPGGTDCQHSTCEGRHPSKAKKKRQKGANKAPVGSWSATSRLAAAFSAMRLGLGGGGGGANEPLPGAPAPAPLPAGVPGAAWLALGGLLLVVLVLVLLPPTPGGR